MFKVFVANPNKPEPIVKILVKNKDKMLKFLSSFHNDRAKEDEQFAEVILIAVIVLSKKIDFFVVQGATVSTHPNTESLSGMGVVVVVVVVVLVC